jgi:outer membrane protein
LHTFGFLDFASIHAREASQAATLKAEMSRETLVGRQLQEQFVKHKPPYERCVALRRILLSKSPLLELCSPRQPRYKAGLSSIDDVAQAQRLVVQAEMDDSIARLNVWRAFLQLQFVRGDLQPFLQAAQ